MNPCADLFERFVVHSLRLRPDPVTEPDFCADAPAEFLILTRRAVARPLLRRGVNEIMAKTAEIAHARTVDPLHGSRASGTEEVSFCAPEMAVVMAQTYALDMLLPRPVTTLPGIAKCYDVRAAFNAKGRTWLIIGSLPEQVRDHAVPEQAASFQVRRIQPVLAFNNSPSLAVMSAATKPAHTVRSRIFAQIGWQIATKVKRRSVGVRGKPDQIRLTGQTSFYQARSGDLRQALTWSQFPPDSQLFEL